MENGTHLNIPGLQIIPATGIRLVPHDATGLLTVDGEVVPYGPLEAHVMPGAGRVMVR